MTPNLSEAACAGHPLPLWDVTVSGETQEEREARRHKAKAICRRCPVGQSCAAVAIPSVDEGIRNGVDLPPLQPWAGSKKQRLKARTAAASQAEKVAS